MADEVREPTPPKNPYGNFKTLSGTATIRSHKDTFFGPNDKRYADFVARDGVRLRGTNAFFYVRDDHSRRIDGFTPLSDPKPVEDNPFMRKEHAGLALYGEQVVIRERLDSVRREVHHDWAFLDPIIVRGVPYEFDRQEEATDKGGRYINKLTFDLPRVLCEDEWGFSPLPGDTIRFLKQFDTERFRGDTEVYYNIEEVHTNESRFGSTGFFTIFKLTLWRSSQFEPQRAIPDRKLTEDDEIEEIQVDR